MPVQGVVQGQVHANHLQGIQQNAPQGLNGQAVRLGGNQVLRGLQDAFTGVKNFVKSIGDRVQAHHQANVEKSRTSAANRGAQKVIDGLLKSPASEGKVISGLMNLAEKAAKLNPTDPQGKAISLLENKLDGLTAEQKNKLFTGDFALTKHLMTELGRISRDKSNLVAQALHDTGFVDGDPPVPLTGPSAKEQLAGRLLDHLADLGKQHFKPELDQLQTDLNHYFTSQNMTAQLMFRGNTEVTKSMAKHLTTINGPALDHVKQQTIDLAKGTEKLTGQMEIGSYGKLKLDKLSPEQFQEILNGAGEIMKSMMGGATVDGANSAALNLNPNIVRLLKMQDAEVTQHLNGDATARKTAFVGTLFLRSLTSALTDAQPNQSEHRAGIMKVFSQVVTFALNQSSDAAGKMEGLSPENQTAITKFVTDHALAIDTFRNTVLARTDV